MEQQGMWRRWLRRSTVAIISTAGLLLVGLLVGPNEEGAPIVCGDRQAAVMALVASDGLSVQAARAVYDHACAQPLGKLEHTGTGSAIAKEAKEQAREKAQALAIQAPVPVQEEVPPGALLQAMGDVQAMQRSQKAGLASKAGIGPDAWRWAGPGNIGGRIRPLVIHPTNHNTMWVGGDSGGIWKTTDGGTSWAFYNDFMASLSVSSLVMAGDDPDTLYAGTGGFLDAMGGVGIFKTTNGGTDWVHLESSSTLGQVNRLAIAPDNSNLLLVATSTGISRTTDAGATWTTVAITDYIMDVDFNPQNAQEVIASGYRQALYSVDGGATWATATGIPYNSGRLELVYAASDPQIVYGSLDRARGELWKSTDGGHSYELINTGQGMLGGVGWFANAIWVDPTNPQLLLVGGLFLHRSFNGGTTFEEAPLFNFHVDQHGVVPHPAYDGTTNKTVFIVNDGGVTKFTDVYEVPEPPFEFIFPEDLNHGLGVTQLYDAAIDAEGKFIAGTQDNGSLLSNPAGGTEGWQGLCCGDVSGVATDPTDANYLYAKDVFDSQDPVMRSADGGETFESIAGMTKSAPYIISDIATHSRSLLGKLVLDPQNPERLIVTGLRTLWRTDDAKTANTATTGPTWRVIQPLTYYIDGESQYEDMPLVATIAPGNSDLIWVGHNFGQVFKTTNGTVLSPTWENMGGDLPRREVSEIAIDPNNHQNVFVAYKRFMSDNLWRTTDGGLNWTDITGANCPTACLPDVPILSVVVHPTNPDWLYVATELGVFASEDGGATWGTALDGPAAVRTTKLFWAETTPIPVLAAATYGRGLFTATLDVSSCGRTLDITGDDRVSVADIQVVAGGFGGTVETHNVDCTGGVDVADVTIIASAWQP